MKNLSRLFIFLIIILATSVGIYGQDISYYISKNIIEISPLHCLTILTAISIVLFLITHTMIYKNNGNGGTEDSYFQRYFLHNKKERMKRNIITLPLIINSMVGIVVSFFSIFVLLMWWS